MAKLSRKHVVFYIVWLVAFVAVEVPAAISDADGDTLSEMFWSLMDANRAWAVAVAAFVTWLWFHFAPRVFK